MLEILPHCPSAVNIVFLLWYPYIGAPKVNEVQRGKKTTIFAPFASAMTRQYICQIWDGLEKPMVIDAVGMWQMMDIGHSRFLANDWLYLSEMKHDGVIVTTKHK